MESSSVSAARCPAVRPATVSDVVAVTRRAQHCDASVVPRRGTMAVMALAPTAAAWRVLARVVNARPDELPAVLLSITYFFSLLCGYYILRPLREEMGIAGGVENLPWVFTATFLAMLAVVPFFGWLTT